MLQLQTPCNNAYLPVAFNFAFYCSVSILVSIQPSSAKKTRSQSLLM